MDTTKMAGRMNLGLQKVIHDESSLIILCVRLCVCSRVVMRRGGLSLRSDYKEIVRIVREAAERETKKTKRNKTTGGKSIATDTTATALGQVPI